MSRDFPTPASPTTVTSRHRRSSIARSESAEQLLELGVAADHGRVESPWPLGILAHPDQAIRGNGLGLALELERLDLLHVDVVAHEAVGEVSEQDLLRAGCLLEASGDVDRVAGDESLARHRVACDDLARVHAGANREANAPVPLELVVQLRLDTLHVRGSTNRSKGVVLVELRQPEDRHDRIADELLDHASVALELGAHRVEVPSHHLAERLRVELFAHGRRALEVREHDRHDLAVLVRGGSRRERRPARQAELGDLRVLGTALRADRHEPSLQEIQATASETRSVGGLH